MHRHHSLLLSSWAYSAALLACAPVLAATENTDKPNILFVLIDDMGWKDIGCAGSTYYETPHIDELASEGMRLLNAYSAAPVCTPSRGALFSGKCPARTQLTTVFRGPAGPDDRLHDRSKYRGEKDQYFESRHRHALPRTEVILPQALATGGYRTGFFGKWHIGECPDYYPDDRGFHVAKGYRTKQDASRSHWMKDFHKDAANLEGASKDAYVADVLTEECIDFKPGTSEQRIVGMDFYPTMLAAAGLPLRPEQHVDGLDLMPLLTQDATLKKRFIVFHFPHVKSHQPNCIVIANNSHDFRDTDIHSYEYPYLKKSSPARALPPENNKYPAEVCDTIGPSWFWKTRENKANLQTAEEVVAMLKLCNSRRANYLLNVAPDKSGLIPAYSLERLRKIGEPKETCHSCRPPVHLAEQALREVGVCHPLALGPRPKCGTQRPNHQASFASRFAPFNCGSRQPLLANILQIGVRQTIGEVVSLDYEKISHSSAHSPCRAVDLMFNQ